MFKDFQFLELVIVEPNKIDTRAKMLFKNEMFKTVAVYFLKKYKLKSTGVNIVVKHLHNCIIL